MLLYTSLSDRYTGSQGVLFALLNVIAHGIIDWNIWKLYKFTVLIRHPGADIHFAYYDDSMFYNFIALDQALHGLCYLLTDNLVRQL